MRQTVRTPDSTLSLTSALCASFKAELPQAIHNFTNATGHLFKCALFTASPSGTYGAATPNYSAMGTDELANGAGYATGGFAWSATQNITPAASGTQAYWSWSANPTWANASFSTSGCLIYNSSATNRAVACFSFGGTQTVTAGTFTVSLPPNGPGTSVLQLN